MSLTPVIYADSLPTKTIEDDEIKKLCRRTELPVYSSKKSNIEENVVLQSSLFNAVRYVRIEGCKVANAICSVTDRCSRFIFTGIAHTKINVDNTLDYLHEERNLLGRIGAVGVGTFTGYLLGLRRGYLRRLLYATSSGLAIATVCYPSEAKVYGNQALLSARRYFIIGYHFCNGVTKDVTGFGLPSFPLRLLNPDLERFLANDTSQSKDEDSDLYSNHNKKA